MANLTVQKVENNKAGITPILKDLQDTSEMIRQRAFELFEGRGRGPGQELDDWIQAERDLFWVLPAELVETDKEIQITVAVPDFDPTHIQVTARPGEILVLGDFEKRLEKKEKGASYSEFEEKALYRRFKIAQPIDVDRVTANVENGMLTVKAPKKAPQANVDEKAATAA
jgi:HSP20 family molecular chaperone IbpA